MPRKQKKYHFIYRTTNLLNGKFYVGMHSTDDLEDGYVGSGKRLGYSIRKYGLENHKFEILEFLSSREELKKREAEVVNEELLTDLLCMNLKFGGEGGWDHLNGNNRSKEHQSKASVNGWKTKQNDLEFMEKFSTLHSIKMKECHENGKITPPSWIGKKHSEETLVKMRESHKGLQDGEKNSQFGTCWITNGSEVKKVKNDELHRWLNSGWRKGRRKEEAYEPDSILRSCLLF